VAAGAAGTSTCWRADQQEGDAPRADRRGTGSYILSITDTAKTGFYPCAVVAPVGRAIVGTQLVAGNYG
jgi:hypothetical protein